MDLNGEVPRGPLDAFFMSRPRYTPTGASSERPGLSSPLPRIRSHSALVVCLALARDIPMCLVSPARFHPNLPFRPPPSLRALG